MASVKHAYHFGKSIADNGWSKFLKFVEYKLNEQGKHLQKVNKWYPSSKTCNECGYVHKELVLGERKWTCPECGTCHDRDLNAAINIKKEGYRLYALSA
jgi:putative transposase